MSKYISKFNTATEATGASDLLSPQVSYVVDKNKLLLLNCGDNVTVKIVDNNGELVIEPDYLTFVATAASGISLSNFGGNLPNVEYSKNRGDWIIWDYSNIPMASGDNIRMRGLNTNGFCYNGTKYSQFVMSGSINATGNIMTLIDKTGETKEIPHVPSCFVSLFKYCTALKTCPKLPATTLYGACYTNLFRGCSGLINISDLKLPAMIMTHSAEAYSGYDMGCYRQMFLDCTSLVNTPELPATTLADYCYHSMFKRCTSLVTAPELPATTLANECYCSMFYGCTNLTNAPLIKGQADVYHSYDNMFEDCTKLNYIKCLLENPDSIPSISNWVRNVATSGTFIKKTGITWSRTGASGIPSGWTVEEADE